MTVEQYSLYHMRFYHYFSFRGNGHLHLVVFLLLHHGSTLVVLWYFCKRCVVAVHTCIVSAVSTPLFTSLVIVLILFLCVSEVLVVGVFSCFTVEKNSACMALYML